LGRLREISSGGAELPHEVAGWVKKSKGKFSKEKSRKVLLSKKRWKKR
jgi:hypothetical protein